MQTFNCLVLNEDNAMAILGGGEVFIRVTIYANSKQVGYHSFLRIFIGRPTHPK